jgi:hypothetical protein
MKDWEEKGCSLRKSRKNSGVEKKQERAGFFAS